MKYFLIKPGYPENYGRVDYMDSETQGKILQSYTLDNKPIEELNLDLPLRFEVTFANNDSEKTMLPFYTLNTKNALFRSDFLKSVLAAGGSGIKTLDVVIIERRNGREYHDFKFIIMEKIDIIDKTKKNYWDGLIVLKKDDALVKDIHIFYINDTSILVDEDAKNSIEQHNIRNIMYYNPEKYAGL
jgi:hypothetical protein